MTQMYDTPPRPGTGKASIPSRRNQEVADTLRRNPGKWMIGHTAASRNAADGWAYRVRQGKSPAFTPAGKFEATVRGLDVYVRYTG